ncbi:RidA family protein [Cucumibacter marinus]|uniref:RidA family protein n=1 Tax=Cucumibacter marinus TaxID=1121252 RepID=UPI0003FC7388|nr:RidA family protein [Cucumibacter marinus]
MSSDSAIRFINPEGLYNPTGNGYAHIGIAPAGAELVFISGQGGEDAGEEREPDFRAQLRQAIANVRTALSATDLSASDIVKATVMIVDHSMDRLQIFGEEWAGLFPDRRYPAMTLLPVPCLAVPDMMVEIEIIAARRA